MFTLLPPLSNVTSLSLSLLLDEVLGGLLRLVHLLVVDEVKEDEQVNVQIGLRRTVQRTAGRTRRTVKSKE